jgi:hypothetical protein
MKICRIQGCALPVSGFSFYCEAHKRRNRRHGHPTQLTITAHELQPFRKRVRARIEKNMGNNTWNMLGARWEALIEIAKAEETTYLAGATHSRYEREAWFNVVKIGISASGMEVIEVALAMYLLQEENSQRFKSDAAFGGQLARRVLALAPVNVASYHDNKARKVKRVYRDAKPKTTAILARILQDAFGVAGLTVAHLERYERDKLRNEKQALFDALEELR